MKKHLKSIAVAIFLSLNLFTSAQTHPEYGFYFNFPVGTKLSFATESGAGDISTSETVIVAENENTLTFCNFIKSNGQTIVSNSVMVYHDDTIMMPYNPNSRFGAAEFSHGRVLYIPYLLKPQVGYKYQDINENYLLYSSSYKSQFNISLRERKILEEVSLKTPAGVFDCYIMTYKNAENAEIKEWVSDRVGVVKNEIYNKKGQLTSKTELISIGNI